MTTKSKRIVISLSEVKAKELERLAKKKGVTKSVLVALAIETFKDTFDSKNK